MAYRITGTYVGTCNCNLLCPCPVDGPPTAAGGVCHGAIVMSIKSGSLDGTDLSGVNFALYNEFPSNLSAGKWKLGIVIDEGASDQQAQALQRILSGEEGGPFADFAPLIGDFLGVERAKVTFSNGDSAKASVEGKTEIGFEVSRGADGSPTTVSNAMFGFAPEFRVGRGSGKSNAFGMSYDGVYGESADFEFSSEGGEVKGRI